jgi:phospholipid/cholesterol/gamma-HCH transport system ATP-binding protein
MKKVSIEKLAFENATFGYSPDRPIFSNLSFELPLDRNVLITGPAGNGQSTFLKLLAVLRLPQSGSFLINGADTTQMSFEEFLPLRMQIGYTFDYGGLFANRTLMDNMMLPLLYHKICEPEVAEDSNFQISFWRDRQKFLLAFERW